MSLQSITVAPQAFKKTLVYYYSPGCPYCREFHPVYLQVAKACQDCSSFHVVAVDTSQHENVGIPIQTVPTVVYFDIHGKPHKLQANSVEDRTFEKVLTFFFNNLVRDYGKPL